MVKDKVFLRPDRVVRAALLRMDDQCEIAAGRPPAEERLRALVRGDPGQAAFTQQPRCLWAGSLRGALPPLRGATEEAAPRTAGATASAGAHKSAARPESGAEDQGGPHWNTWWARPPQAVVGGHAERAAGRSLTRLLRPPLAGVLFAQLAVFIRLTYWCDDRAALASRSRPSFACERQRPPSARAVSPRNMCALGETPALQGALVGHDGACGFFLHVNYLYNGADLLPHPPGGVLERGEPLSFSELTPETVGRRCRRHLRPTCPARLPARGAAQPEGGIRPSARPPRASATR